MGFSVSLPTVAALGAALTVPAPAAAEVLFEPGAPRASDVLQSGEGTCFVHANIAALAHTDPDRVRQMIRGPREDGAYEVRFRSPTEVVEVVFPEDAAYARDHGFDRSTGGAWVPIMVRGIAQRILRDRLERSVARMDLGPVNDTSVRALFAGERLVHLDRQIRRWVRQDARLGDLDFTGYAREMASVLVDGSITDPALRAVARDRVERVARSLEGSAVEAGIQRVVREYGLLWGAYRGISAGGSMGEPFRYLFGKPRVEHRLSQRRVTRALAAAPERPTVAGTGSESPELLRRLGLAPTHAYTVLGLEDGQVVLRNPWGDGPKGDGVLRMALDDFQAAFVEVVHPATGI